MSSSSSSEDKKSCGDEVHIPDVKHVKFEGRMLLLGFGAIGTGLLPLILRHLDMKPSQITILDERMNEGRKKIAADYGVKWREQGVTEANYKALLSEFLGAGDCLVNVSVDIGCIDVIRHCQEIGAIYIDSSVEPWPGTYTDANLTMSQRSNYAFREELLSVRAALKPNGPTAVVSHGANPGIVSHFVKQALLNIARDTGVAAPVPKTRQQWGELARALGIKAIHIAERDTQVSPVPKKDGEFVNTWSIDGCLGECSQVAELGWGTHEKEFPADGKTHDFGCQSAIYLARPGTNTKVRTWTPMSKNFHAWLITHNEAVSISDYFTLKEEDGKVAYRPTVHFAYHPSNDCVLSLMEYQMKDFQAQEHKRLLLDDIVDGADELGVLLMGHAKGAYWYGSQLNIHNARKLCPFSCATTLQVAASVLGGLVFALRNPSLGIVEPDEMEHTTVLQVAEPYLYPVVGAYTDWTPLQHRNELFPEDVDTTDPWQFKNIRVV